MSCQATDAFEPTCSASINQHPNLMKLEAALSRWPRRCALHHVETCLCISLPFSISFTANIARKKPELNRDKIGALQAFVRSGAIVNRVLKDTRWNDRTGVRCL